MKQSRLRIIPTTLKQANEYVEQHHRHHKRSPRHKFSIAVVDPEYSMRLRIDKHPIDPKQRWEADL